jgi:hypothetical protein
MRIARIIGIGLAALALAATGASADSAADQVKAKLDSGMSPHAARGYARERGATDLSASLRLDSAFLWPIELRAGVNYRVYGACDDDCTDVDMEIYGTDGALIERDIARDATPFVQVTPAAAGRFYVRIWLSDCSSEPCFVGARIVSGGRPEERAPDQLAGGPDNEYSDVVHDELEDSGAAHLQAGYQTFGDDVIEALQTGDEGHRTVLRLEAGRAYLFQGACDQDCSDVDLEVLDPRGRSVARDVATDDRPVVGVEPTATGDYTVHIWLAQCSVAPCFAGVRSYVRGRGRR